MPDFDRDRLLHYCRMLADVDQGRRLGAARGIVNFMRDNGLDWDAILVKPVTVAGHAFAPAAAAPPHVAFVEELLKGHAAGTFKLSAFEKEFCESMRNWNRAPTEKQQAVLDRLAVRFEGLLSSHVNTHGMDLNSIQARAARLFGSVPVGPAGGLAP